MLTLCGQLPRCAAEPPSCRGVSSHIDTPFIEDVSVLGPSVHRSGFVGGCRAPRSRADLASVYARRDVLLLNTLRDAPGGNRRGWQAALRCSLGASRVLQKKAICKKTCCKQKRAPADRLGCCKSMFTRRSHLLFDFQRDLPKCTRLANLRTHPLGLFLELLPGRTRLRSRSARPCTLCSAAGPPDLALVQV